MSSRSLRSIGIQSGVPCRWLTTATSASIFSGYSAYSGTSVRDGISCAVNVIRSMNSGCCSRKMSKAVNPRRTFFERSARSTRRMENSRRRESTRSSSSRTRGRRATVREVAVDLLVALLEGEHLVPADVRRVAQVPQVVLDEPQQRVGDDVVEAVVGVLVADHQADLVLALLAARQGDG